MNLMDGNAIMAGPALPSAGDADCATDNIFNSSQLNVLKTNSLPLSGPLPASLLPAGECENEVSTTAFSQMHKRILLIHVLTYIRILYKSKLINNWLCAI